MTSHLPTGTVTWLLTDIEGSTRLLGQLGERYAEILEAHQRLLREVFVARGGLERHTEGDSFFVVFRSAPEAVTAAIEGQRALAAHPWPEDGVVRVRMGVHTGEGVLGGDDYVGLDVHRAARIAAAGHGGQILISSATQALVEQALPADTSLKDLGEHRLKDLPHPEHLFQVTTGGLPSEFPTIRSLDARPGNLPSQLTSFIGRGKEIEEIKDLLSGTRLVTLTGPGGTGKTRLSLQVATELLPAFQDGAYFVRLSPITDPTLVTPTIAETLEVRDNPERSPLEDLIEHLRGKEILLLLDNFEQVLPAASEVGELLGATDGLKVLATSREALGVGGEQEYPVPTLELPDPMHLPPLENLTQYEAVRLFIDRAAAVQPGFAVTNDNAPAVAEICARLDGLPLALELAAARVKILSPDAILQRLEHRLALLASGPRDLEAHHKTLRDTIAWSYDLLDGPERRFFARLSVFVGGFTLEAAERVASPVGEVGIEALDGVASLVNKSLIRQMSTDHPDPRYLMLETIREYAMEQIDGDPEEADEIRRRHAAFFRELTEKAEPELTGPNSATWLDTLEQEHNNLRAALEWSATGGRLETALRMGGALWRFWLMRGHLREARDRLTALLGLPETRDHPDARAKALEGAGGITYWMADWDAALKSYEETLAIRRELGDPTGIAEALYNLSFSYAVPPEPRRDIAKAAELLEQSLALFRESGDRGGESRVLWGLAVNHLQAGNPGRAKETSLESLAMHRDLGDRFSEGWSLHQLALISLGLGEMEEAREFAEEGLKIFADAGDLSGIALSVADFGGIAVGQGNLVRGARLFGAANAIEAEAGTGLVANAEETDVWLEKQWQAVAGPEWATVRDEGAALSVDEAVAYAFKRED
jgi:predicted ATPase/class 3 adenylate cyclase